MSAAETFFEILQQEAGAIAQAVKRIDPSAIEAVVELLLKCRGKIIFLGVGKSGMIARKIAGTFTSIGCPSLFMHAADAMHGDLGVVTGADAAIMISNSGETEELSAILPHLRNRKVKVIAIVGNLKSALARNADCVIDATVEKEAGPLNLAPTTSTTVALAIGDALAMAVQERKGVTIEEFAVNHPAGRLGKRLTLRVKDIMHGGENNPAIAPEAEWTEVVRVLTETRLGAVNVAGPGGILAGIVTDGDMRRSLQKHKPADWERLCCRDLMTADPITISPQRLAYEALQIMERRPYQISVLPVVDEQNRAVGLLRLHDVIQAGL